MQLLHVVHTTRCFTLAGSAATLHANLQAGQRKGIAKPLLLALESASAFQYPTAGRACSVAAGHTDGRGGCPGILHIPSQRCT